MQNKITIPGEYIRGIKPWQTMVYRIESYLAANGWPFRNNDLTNQCEPLSTILDRKRLQYIHFPDQTVEVIYHEYPL